MAAPRPRKHTATAWRYRKVFADADVVMITGYWNFLGERRRRHVHVRGIGAQQHVNLVLLDQALGELEQFVRLALIVVSDELDRHFLVELLERDAAGIVDALLPQLVLRQRRRFRARPERTRLRDRIAEANLVGRRAPAQTRDAAVPLRRRGRRYPLRLYVYPFVSSLIDFLNSQSAKVLCASNGTPSRFCAAIVSSHSTHITPCASCPRDQPS